MADQIKLVRVFVADAREPAYFEYEHIGVNTDLPIVLVVDCALGEARW